MEPTAIKEESLDTNYPDSLEGLPLSAEVDILDSFNYNEWTVVGHWV